MCFGFVKRIEFFYFRAVGLGQTSQKDMELRWCKGQCLEDPLMRKVQFILLSQRCPVVDPAYMIASRSHEVKLKNSVQFSN